MSTSIKSCNRCGGAILTGVTGWGGAICMCPANELTMSMFANKSDYQEAEIQQLRKQVAELKADAKRWNYFIETCSEEVAFVITGITGDVTNEQINDAIDAEMLKIGDE